MNKISTVQESIDRKFRQKVQDDKKVKNAYLLVHPEKQGLLNFNDKIAKYLDGDLMSGLHVYRDQDYSGEISIKHLLKQTSRLNDVFYATANSRTLVIKN